MHVYIYETNILVDFVLNKNDRNNYTQEKHPRRVTQDHKLAALIKKRTE